MSEIKEKKRVPISVLVLYSILFYLAWTLYEFLLRPYLDSVQSEALSTLLKDGLVKNIVWTVPALILIVKNGGRLFADLKEMFTFKKEDAKYLFVFLFFTVYLLLNLVIHGSRIEISDTFCLSDIIVVLFVGVTEELVFRGWLLNATLERGEELAIGINSLMFLCIHFPIWIYEGVFVTNFTSLGFLTIIMLSIIFGYVFAKTKNIILPITLHMYWDLLMFLFF